MKDKVSIAITGVGGRSVGHQILQSVLLHKEKFDIVVTDADPFSYGLYQVEKRYVVPKANDNKYIPAILDLIKRETVQIILPGTEAELKLLSENRSILESSGCILLGNPANVIDICNNKWDMFQWLIANDFGTPKSVKADQWPNLVAETGFPFVGKPTTNSGGSRHVAILATEDEVLQYLDETNGAEIIFQEYVGHADDEYTVGVLLSKKGVLIDSIVVHRNLTGLSLGSERQIADKSYTLSTGYSQGYIIRHPLIQDVCERLAVKLGMQGPANIQCRLVGDRVKIFEVHPRFSGTTSIRALAGFNEPDILVRNFLYNEEFQRLPYQADVAAIRAFANILVPLKDLNNISHL